MSLLHHSPLHTLFRRWKVLLLAGVLIGLVAGLLTLAFPLKYRSDAQVLIISKSRFGVDPYTVVKSAERVGENIIQIMQTSDFYQKVREQNGHDINWSSFDSLGERDRRKLWNKTISPSVVYGTGVLNVSAYHRDKSQAQKIAGASIDALVAKGWEYVGGDVTIKIVNEPIVTKWPVRPNILLNIILGFIVGIFGMGILTLKK